MYILDSIINNHIATLLITLANSSYIDLTLKLRVLLTRDYCSIVVPTIDNRTANSSTALLMAGGMRPHQSTTLLPSLYGRSVISGCKRNSSFRYRYAAPSEELSCCSSTSVAT